MEGKDRRRVRSSRPVETEKPRSASDLVTILLASGVMALLWRFLG
jgi:hypothetical protein